METPLSTPVRPADLVAVQPGSVVSRIVLKNAGGNLTLFAFAEGEELAEHSTPHDAVVQVLEGEAVVTIAGVDHTVHAGRMLHLPASVPHALRAESAFKMLLTMLRHPPSGG